MKIVLRIVFSNINPLTNIGVFCSIVQAFINFAIFDFVLPYNVI